MNAAASSPTTYPLPNIAQVRELLGMLFDGMIVKAAPKFDLSPQSNAYFGVYIAAGGAPVALCACDIAFAANCGAALSMLPPNAAKDAAKSKELTEVMVANLREVMNICTRLLLHENTPHLKLDALFSASKLPEPAAAIIAAAKGRIDFEITLAKYGPGLFAVISL